jgi:hypothetical protein
MNTIPQELNMDYGPPQYPGPPQPPWRSWWDARSGRQKFFIIAGSAFLAIMLVVGLTSTGNVTVVMTPSQLASSVKVGSWGNTGETVVVTSAQCEPNSVAANGTGSYQCFISDTIDGAPGAFSTEIMVGPDGSWVTSNN